MTWTSPYKVLGANYGLTLDIPFVIADGNDSAALAPVLSIPRSSVMPGAVQNSRGVTKGSIGDIYLEPIDLGWHFRYFDAVASSGVIMPSGPYNSKAILNIGSGAAAGVFGLGAVAYADAEHTWALSAYAHYLLYASQMGRPYTLGDVMPLEWGAGKTFALDNDLFKQIIVGAVGYAQWQVADNGISLTPHSKVAAAVLNKLTSAHAEVYSAGPAINLLTKWGVVSLRYYEEFGTHAAASGRQLMFDVTF